MYCYVVIREISTPSPPPSFPVREATPSPASYQRAREDFARFAKSLHRCPWVTVHDETVCTPRSAYVTPLMIRPKLAPKAASYARRA